MEYKRNRLNLGAEPLRLELVPVYSLSLWTRSYVADSHGAVDELMVHRFDLKLRKLRRGTVNRQTFTTDGQPLNGMINSDHAS